MPLKIPDILENAANVLAAVKALPYNATNKEIGKVKHAARLVSPDDLQAVMNEVGHVYMAVNNMQISRLGSAPDIKDKALQIVLIANFGTGERQIIVPLPMENAQQFLKGINECMATLQLSGGGLITDASVGG